MQNRWAWTRTGLITLLAVTLMSVPQLARADQRCGSQGYYNGGSRSSYGRDVQRYGNQDRSGVYRDYRNSSYRGDRYSNSTYGDNGYYGANYGEYQTMRPAGQSAAIIGGSAAAGAVVGGLSGGKKGAIIGAAVGAAGGLIYDRTTRNNGRSW